MNVTVYCGSSLGEDPCFVIEARALGEWIASRGHTLVYGGSHAGLMGLISDTVLDGGGKAIGVLPRILFDREPPHERLTKLYRVETMGERKAKMIELGDVFVAMPGGPGTLEELSEIMSLVKLGTSPGLLYLLNVNGYYDELISMYDRMLDHGFMTPDMRACLDAPSSARELAAALDALNRA